MSTESLTGGSLTDAPTRRAFGITDEEHEFRMAAARARAEWELGDSAWAAVIVGAYLYPVVDRAHLAMEVRPRQGGAPA